MVIPFHHGKTIFQIVMETLLSIFPQKKIILATSVNPNDEKLVEVAQMYGIQTYRGSEDDVLGRFVDVVEKYSLDAVLRICADNPFLIVKNLKELSEKGLESSADYLAYFFRDNLPTIRSHSGFFGEWVSADALKKAKQSTQDLFYHEHVTNFIYGNERLFNIEKLQVPEENFCRQVRLTVDTQSDFDTASEIYSNFKNDKEVTIDAIKDVVTSKPEYLDRMKEIIAQYAK